MKNSAIENPYPAFLGIGAARSGTTWIDAQLQKSPEIWMPRRKELHYFTRSHKYPSPSLLADSSVFQRLFSFSRHNIRFKKEMIKAFGRDFVCADIEQLIWDGKYFFGSYSDEWYLNLFKRYSRYISGEITPAYSLLDAGDLSRLYKLLPHLKIIFIMRDPIDRAWSTIRYHEKREKKPLTSLPIQEIIRYLDNDAISERSNYIDILKRWKSCFPEEQILTAFYDEISASPGELLDRICDFLCVKRIQLSEKEMKRRVNVSIESEMPDAVKQYLNKKYRDQIEQLAAVFGKYPREWLARIEKEFS